MTTKIKLWGTFVLNILVIFVFRLLTLGVFRMDSVHAVGCALQKDSLKTLWKKVLQFDAETAIGQQSLTLGFNGGSLGLSSCLLNESTKAVSYKIGLPRLTGSSWGEPLPLLVNFCIWCTWSWAFARGHTWRSSLNSSKSFVSELWNAVWCSEFLCYT